MFFSMAGRLHTSGDKKFGWGVVVYWAIGIWHYEVRQPLSVVCNKVETATISKDCD
jgi:hypothetical protein